MVIVQAITSSVFFFSPINESKMTCTYIRHGGLETAYTSGTTEFIPIF
jgi:hypothetical protein